MVATVRKTKAAGCLILAATALLALSACGSADTVATGNGVESAPAKQATQTFYDTTSSGKVSNKLVISGSDVTLYDDGECLPDQDNWGDTHPGRGIINADNTQIAWSEVESGTDDVVIAGDGQTIKLQGEAWKVMDEAAALALTRC